ncbi:D-glycerate 3-kinase [Colwellia chukchiensis]|uniref:D-glycerate 3-kinase n=1 Tax=Colwellia chukchiensis TaxID=641665 RepID=A0A1H7SWW2_9GAMM|nr:kinase [Colwellia chukchiensis]SEL76815.1 D-glycerate 3-kinase [Colwellia chukchiensis]
MLTAFIKQQALPASFKDTALRYYQPLAAHIFSQFKKNAGVYFVGINGCQGSGKSTLSDFLAAYLTATYAVNVVVMSLDDFYFSSAQRQQLANDIQPLLATRGVPGTHDIGALKRVLHQLKTQQTGFAIPRFNKATDEPFAKTQWPRVTQATDIVLLEGWCWGVRPETEQALNCPVNELERQHDSKGIWRKFVNQQLKEQYQPLYPLMDFWLVLQAPSFDCVYQWRLEQEQKLQAAFSDQTQSKIMSEAELLGFIQYFQRLSMHALDTITQSADLVFYLDRARKICQQRFVNHQQ